MPGSAARTHSRAAPGSLPAGSTKEELPAAPGLAPELAPEIGPRSRDAPEALPGRSRGAPDGGRDRANMFLAPGAFVRERRRRGELPRKVSSVCCVLHLMLRVERIDLRCSAWRANIDGGEAFHPPPPEPELLPCVR